MSVCVKLGKQGGGGTIVVSEGVIKGGFGIEPAQREGSKECGSPS